MARSYDGATQYHAVAKAYLSGSGGPFTIALRMTPRTVDVAGNAMSSGTGTAAIWTLAYGYSAGTVSFQVVGAGGTDPSADLFAVTQPEVDAGFHVAVRYNGAGGELAAFKDGDGTVLAPATTFTMPVLGANTTVGGALSGLAFWDGSVAEVAIWQAALSDAQIAELAAGVAADVVAPGGLLAYWPLRGHSAPELNYAVPADVLLPTGAPPIATHPTIVPPWVADVVEPSWIVDLVHPDLGTVRAASRPVTEEHDWDILGAAYPEQLSGDIRLIDQLPDVGLSLMVPATTVIQILNSRDTFDATQDWRGVPVTIRYYDRVSHALTVEFSGVVTDQDISNQHVSFTCANQDAAILEQLVPRAVIEQADNDTGVVDTDGGTTRRDIGAPIPVVCGEGGLLFPPYISFSGGTAVADLNGHDLLIGFGAGAVVRKVSFDYDSFTPGLEPGTLWDAAQGTLSYVNGSVFTVAGAGLDLWYDVGRPVRSSNNGGITWHYSHVSAVNLNGTTGGTVTLATSILGGSLGTVQSAGDYSVHADRYQFVGAGGTTALTGIRFYGDTQSAIVAEVGETTRSNPADAIRCILNDPDVGLGEPVNAASFDQAADDFGDAGLASAVRDVLGCDKQQRRAVEVFNELASIRRARIWKDAATEEWMIKVDTDPGASVATFEFGPGTKGNVAEVLSTRPTTLDTSVSTVKLRYERLGRDRGAKSMELTDYVFACRATANAKGKEEVFTNPWLRSTVSHLEPARVCYHVAKTLQREDWKPIFRVRHQGRRVALGDVVTLNLVTSPGKALTGDWRVLKRERTLTDFTFTVGGPWDADVFVTDPGTIQAYVTSPESETDPDERVITAGADANLILNADFSAGLQRQAVSAAIDGFIIPGWVIQNGQSTSNLTSIDYVTDPGAKGGGYLELVVPAAPAAAVTLIAVGPTHDPTLAPINDPAGIIAVKGGGNYLFSLYPNRLTAIELAVVWFGFSTGYDFLGVVIPQLRVAPGDVNGLGHKRLYAIASAPPGAKLAYVQIALSGQPGTPTTYRLDAVQFEDSSRQSLRPTPWKRNPQYGIHPTAVQAGDFLVRGDGEIENGSRVKVYNFDPVGLSGHGTVTLGTLQPGVMTGLTGRVIAGLGGATAWKVALSYGGGTVRDITSPIGTVATTTFSDGENLFPTISIRTPTPLVAIAVGGTAFSAGTVRVSAHMMEHVAPSV